MNPDALYETALGFLQQVGIFAVLVCAAALLGWLVYHLVKALYGFFCVVPENRALAVKAYLLAPLALRQHAVTIREGDKTVKRRARLVGYVKNPLKSQVTMTFAWPTKHFETDLAGVKGESLLLGLGFPEGTGFSLKGSKKKGRSYEHLFSLVAVLPVDASQVTDWRGPS